MLIIYIRIYLCKRQSIEIIKIHERETNLEKAIDSCLVLANHNLMQNIKYLLLLEIFVNVK